MASIRKEDKQGNHTFLRFEKWCSQIEKPEKRTSPDEEAGSEAATDNLCATS
jgi:hypothetical protein